MTTSFALLMRGDLLGSLRANWVGTLLALGGLLYVPWSLACVCLRRTVYIESLEKALLWGLLGFMVLLIGRWALVMVLIQLSGT
jgi:hypothetical protein